MGQELGPVPLAHLGAEALVGDFAHAEHDMGVRLGEPVGSHIPMDIQIGDHAPVDELASDKVRRRATGCRRN